ncbi:MAG: carbohydrate ABC transporter permease [Clostridia bacterium]|nr:carbohydrate ABC transporter permease [Clostridia bacterium]
MNPKSKHIVRITGLSLLAAIWLLPILISFASALKSPNDFITSRFYHMPLQVHIIENLNTATTSFALMRHFTNSLLYAVLGTLSCILVSSMAAYGISIVKPKFSFLIFMLIYAGTVFPFQMYLLPLYQLYISTNLYDTRLGMVLFYATICTPFATFVYRGHFMSFSHEIRESAMIDGCSAWSAFPLIYAPLLKVPTAVVMVFQAMWIWNDLLFGMVLSQGPSVRPVMVSIAQIAGEGGGNLTVLMTAVLVTSIPTLTLFVCLRNYFIQGTAFGLSKPK